MLNESLPIISKIISALFFLVSGILWKKVLTNNTNHTIIFYRTVFSVTLMAIAVCFFIKPTELTQPFTSVSFADWLLTSALCLFSFWGLYFFTSAIQTGRFSFINSIAPIATVFSFLTSIFVYHETISTAKYFALAIVIIGFLIHQREQIMQFKISNEVFLILLSSLFWGISFVFYLKAIQQFGVLYFGLIMECCVLISSYVLILFKDKKTFPKSINQKSLFTCFVIGAMVTGGSILSYFTLTKIPVSINILLGFLFEIIILIVGIFIFNDSLKQKDWVLITAATAAGFLMLF